MDMLIGRCPLEVVLDNHSNHFQTIASLMGIGRLDILYSIVPWVYLTYLSQGVSREYFPAVFRIYRSSVNQILSSDSALEIAPLYDWLIQEHDGFLDLLNGSSNVDKVHISMDEENEAFVTSLLEGDYSLALSIVNKKVEKNFPVEKIYSDLFQPALYRVGDLWQKNIISIAHEHMASVMVARLMVNLYDRFLPTNDRYRGKAVVTSALNEYHDIGAQMVSDFLEKNDWEVNFLGGNVPVRELIDFVREANPDILAISISMVFNLANCRSLIETVRNDPDIKSVRIMVGGQAFRDQPELWKTLGADIYAPDASSAVKLAEICRLKKHKGDRDNLE